MSLSKYKENNSYFAMKVHGTGKIPILPVTLHSKELSTGQDSGLCPDIQKTLNVYCIGIYCFKIDKLSVPENYVI